MTRGAGSRDGPGEVKAMFEGALTALVTLPFAYVGELAWNVAWLALIPIGALLKRRNLGEE